MSNEHDVQQAVDWQRFVLDNGFRALAYELAAVLAVPVEDVERVRRSGACARLAKGKDFAELFCLWHGRAPTDEEWPKPRKVGADGTYEWHGPEIALLARLVGQLGTIGIAQALTARLRSVTGDATAERSANAVQVRKNMIGMQSSDVIGGITTADAGREIGSMAIVRHAISSNEIRTTRVGSLLVIPHDVWAEWKSKRVAPPEGFVQLSTLREALGIKSDKLSEFARMGYVPTAIRSNPYGVKGPTTQFGSWYISADVAEQLLSDRRSGKAMPWHGKPMLDNLKKTYKLWESRRHPPECESCHQIWGDLGAPVDFDDYVRRYRDIAFGAKRHLTMIWTPGLTIAQVALQAGCSASHVRRAMESGVLNAACDKAPVYVSRTDATRWIARKCPTGDSAKSWISLETASKQYGFSLAELRDMIANGTLTARDKKTGDSRSTYVGRHQCGQLREQRGFTEDEAASRIGITVARLHKLLEGVQWREADGIPLSAVQTVIKRLQSREGYTLDEAAEELGVSLQWVKDRKDDGTIRVAVAKWDRRRLYVTGPMLERLRHALRHPDEHVQQLSDEWLYLSDAALEAGVSTCTIIKWADNGELNWRDWNNRRRYHREAVRARARKYWDSVRFHRAVPPTWLAEEGTAGALSTQAA